MRYVPYEPMPRAAIPLGSASLLPRWSRAALGVLEGGVLATASLSAVELWEPSGERARGRFELAGSARGFCASGRWIAVADERTSQLEIATMDGEPVASIAHTPCPDVLALSPGARWVVYGGGGYKKDADKRLHVADVSTGTKVAELKGGRNPVRSLAFAPDGACFAAAIDTSARVWSTAAMPKLGPPTTLAHPDPVHHVSFSPDGEALYTLTPREARGWSLATGEVLWRFALDAGAKDLAALAHTSHGVVVALERSLALLDARGSVIAKASLGDGLPHRLAASGDSLFVSEAFAGRVRRFRLPALTEVALPGPGAWLEALVSSADHRRALSCGWDRKAELWEIASGRLLRTLRGPAFPSGGAAKAGCFLPDGSVVIAFGHELRRFAPDREEPAWSRRHEHGWDISLLIASHDGALVVACDAASRRTYGHVSVLDAASGEERVMRELRWTIEHAHVEGELVILLGSAGALTLDPAKGEIVKERRIDGSYWGTGMALSPDGRTCTRPASRKLSETRWTVHSLERDEAVTTLELGEDAYPAAFALGGAVLVTTCPTGLRYFDATSGAELGAVTLGDAPHRVRPAGDRDLVSLRSGALYAVERPELAVARPERRAPEPADVAALFEVEPSAEAWKLACAALDRTGDPAILERVERACARWPDALRRAPAGWIDDAISDRPQPRLRIVRALRTTHLRSSGARALVAAPELSLAIFDVSQGELEDDDAIAIARRWPDLEELRLHAVGLGPKAAKGLSSVPFTRLARLDLGGNALTGPAVAPLLGAPLAAQLRYLALDRNKKLAHPRSIEALATSRELSGLWALDLAYTKVPIDAILRAAHLSSLRSLAIDDSELTDAELIALAGAPHLAGLEVLMLGTQRKLSRAGLGALEALPTLRVLECYPAERGLLDGFPRLAEARQRYSAQISTGFTTWGWLFEHEHV